MNVFHMYVRGTRLRSVGTFAVRPATTPIALSRVRSHAMVKDRTINT